MRLLRLIVLFATLCASLAFAALSTAAPAATSITGGSPLDRFSSDAAESALTHEIFLPNVTADARILFLGDSFSNGLDQFFPRLSASATPPVEQGADVIWEGGRPLDQQWKSATLDRVRSGDYRAVVLQDDLADHWSDDKVDDFYVYARKFNYQIKRVGARTVFYMTWEYRDRGPSIGQIETVYDKIAAELGADVAPVGLAFARAQSLRPSLDLLISDGVHANADGFYLMMCVLYDTLYDRSPVGLPYHLQDVTAGHGFGDAWQMPSGWTMPPADVTFLQQVAADTVAEYEASR